MSMCQIQFQEMAFILPLCLYQKPSSAAGVQYFPVVRCSGLQTRGQRNHPKQRVAVLVVDWRYIT